MSEDRSRVVMESDGTREGTKVWLHVIDKNGHEVRYLIPNIISVDFEIGKAWRPKSDKAILMLEIGDVRVRTTVQIGSGKTTVEDLLAEIAASRLNQDKGKP